MTANPDETVMGFIAGPWFAQAVRAAEGTGPQATARFLRAGLRRIAATPVDPPYVVIAEG